MRPKKIFFTIFFLWASAIGYTQENFEGTVVQQRFIRLKFKSPVKLQEPVKVNIKRMELGRYQIPYSNGNQIPYSSGVERFIQSFDIAPAPVIFEATLELESDSSGMVKYEDHTITQGYSYIYWIQSRGGKIIAGPLCLKVRDPNLWWSQEKIELTMDSLTRFYPNVVRKHTFGKTREGNPINGLLVGNLNNAIVLIGNNHAGESGAELHLYTIEQILANNKDLLNKAGIIIIPVLNIDSRNCLINGIPDYQRANSNGVDLNRNFPADWETVDSSYGVQTNDPFSSTYRGPSPASEPETKTVIRMIETYKPKVIFDYHWMGCITGNSLLSYIKKTEILPELHQYAKCFNEGFYENTKNPPKYRMIESSDHPGTLPRYCIIKKNIPAYSVEGNNQEPILNRASSDMATEEDLHEYQQKHYHAILSVLKYLSNTTDKNNKL